MAKTLNPPKQVTCGNTSQSLDLNNSTVKVIIRNRSGTQAANVNIGYAAPADDTTPQQDGDDAITLFPVGGDDVEAASEPLDSVGIQVWPRYELVVPVTGSLPVYAVRRHGGADVDTRILEIGG